MAAKKKKKKTKKKKTGPKPGLRMTPNRELFCQQVAAFPKKSHCDIYMEVWTSCSKPAAAMGASRLLTYDIILNRIAELRKPAMDKLDISVERTMTELARGGYYDPALAFDKESNTLLDIWDMPQEIRAAISSVETKELFDGDNKLIGYTKKVRFHNKPKNLELLGKTNKLNLYTEHHTVDQLPVGTESIKNATKDIAKDIAKEVAKINKSK